MRLRLRSYLWSIFLPIAVVWAGVARFRRWYRSRRAYRSQLPVVSVGNLHSGGCGKTPIVLEIAKRLAASRPVILSRGYRGEASKRGEWVTATASGNGAALYGDEPWMLRQLWHGDIYVGADRVEAAKRLEAERPGAMILLDDGFQHVTLARDADLLLVPVEERWEDGFCLPLGDLREGWSAARLATAVLLVGGTDEQARRWEEFLGAVAPGVPRFRARRRDDGLWDGEHRLERKGERLGGFCGIARPERFRDLVLAMGNSVFLAAFPDHHEYGEQDVRRLLRRGADAGVDCFVTTDKDWPKAAPFFSGTGARVCTARVGYEFSDEFWYLLERRIKRAPSAGHVTT